MRAFFLLIMAVAVSMLVIPLAMRLAPRLGMVDQPDPRKVHLQPVPRVGGWGIAAGCLLPLLLLDGVDPLLRAYLAGSMVLFLFGAWDDSHEAGHWTKFAGQIIACGVVVFWGQLYVTRMPFFDGEVLGPAGGQLFTMFAMIGVVNAINHSDGLDGLAAGEALLSFVAIAFLGYLAHARVVTDVALAAIGGTIGFLRYNTHPARVFMGDSGSQFLGFTVAFLIVYFVQVANPAVSAALPLLLLGLPIADILVVLYKRASGGMNWFKATRNHVHHRLLDLGLTHYQSVVFIYVLQAVLVMCAVLMRYSADGLVIATYFSGIVALFAILALAERSGWRMAGEVRTGLRGFGSRIECLQRSPALRLALLWSIAIAVPVLCLSATLWVREIPRDFGVIAAVAAGGLVLVSLFRSSVQPLSLRACAYIAATFAAWLFTNYPRAMDLPSTGVATGAIVVLALAVAGFIRFMSDQRFGTTPTDFLIVFAVIALTVFWRVAGNVPGGDGTLRFITYAVVLFYACEVIIGHLRQWRAVLGGSAFAVLLIVALRGLSTVV
jgi:UDP-GlcNAc:undecaprenyl-phosphate GlcNAc-1-phosphate transferase